MSKLATLIGISDYKANGKLQSCAVDIKELGKALEQNEDGKTNFQVKYVPDVTKKESIREHLIDLFSRPLDVALFYFSGHGVQTSSGEYLVAPDYTEYDPGISLDEVMRIVNNSRAIHKIVILDCCFGGAVNTLPITHATKQISILAEGVCVITSSTEYQTSIGYNSQRPSLFTNQLIQAIKGGAADISGKITLSGIYAYIERALQPDEPRPLFKSNIMQMITISEAKERINIKVLRELPNYFSSADAHRSLDKSYEWTEYEKYKHLKNPPENPEEENIIIFRHLQDMTKQGLIKPSLEQTKDMYWVAINEESCCLTELGKHYWYLAKNNNLR
ncbi:MAG: caspase family protein [Chitinophagaceae bacterium]|nr:caspase family protein [Chitinophagaceae bacterium]